MHDFDAEAPIVRKRRDALDKESQLSINLTPQIEGLTKLVDAVVERHPNTTYIGQTQEELLLLLWGEEFDSDYLSGIPHRLGDRFCRDDKARFFVDPATWRAYLKDRDFVLGTRLHGTVAAITAGTPAHLLVHDSRTLELAEFHGLPWSEMPVDSGTSIVEDLYESCNLDELNRLRMPNRRLWEEFLNRNGISHIHSEGMANREYADLLENLNYPAGVRAITALSSPELASRVHWLWQGIRADQTRPHGAYHPVFEPETQRRESSVEYTRRVETRVSVTEAATAAARADLDKLKRDHHELRQRMTGYLEYVQVPFERRLVRAVRSRLARLVRKFSARRER